jgi:hypothetical protein
MHNKSVVLLAGAAIASVVACSDPYSGGTVGLAFSTRPAPNRPLGGALSAAVQLGDTVVLNGDSIIIETAEVVLQEVQLEGEDVTTCTTSTDDDGDDDGCEEFTTGVQLVSLPLGTETEKVVTINGVPTGMYDEVEFSLHAPISPGDDAFIAANPNFNGISIRVTGFYRPSGASARTAFTYTTPLSQQEEVELSPPLDVAADGIANITIRIDVSTWFLNASGTGVIDPATAGPGGANEALVESNIQQSINAFQDDDSDGLDDDSEDDDGGTEPDDDDS